MRGVQISSTEDAQARGQENAARVDQTTDEDNWFQKLFYDYFKTKSDKNVTI